MVLKDEGVNVVRRAHYNEIHHKAALSIQCLKLTVKIIMLILMILHHVCVIFGYLSIAKKTGTAWQVIREHTTETLAGLQVLEAVNIAHVENKAF